MNFPILTPKAIALMCGYCVEERNGYWRWRSVSLNPGEKSMFEYSSKDAAYLNCCIECGLVET